MFSFVILFIIVWKHIIEKSLYENDPIWLPRGKRFTKSVAITPKLSGLQFVTWNDFNVFVTVFQSRVDYIVSDDGENPFTYPFNIKINKWNVLMILMQIV